MLILFPSLLVYCKHLMYGKNELVKNDGGSVNVYHPICEAGVQPVLKANGEPEERSKPETTLTLNLRVYFFVLCFLICCNRHEGISFLLGPFMYLIAVTTHPHGFPLSLLFSLLAPGIPSFINDNPYHNPVTGSQHHTMKAVGDQ